MWDLLFRRHKHAELQNLERARRERARSEAGIPEAKRIASELEAIALRNHLAPRIAAAFNAAHPPRGDDAR